MRSRKHSQAAQVLQDLRVIDSAVDQYAIEQNKSTGASVAWSESNFTSRTALGSTRATADIFGNAFTLPTVDTVPKVSMTTYSALSDIAPAGFWSPYR
jgi:hypothetical protein